MVTDAPTGAALPVPDPFAAGVISPGFDERWAAWQRRGVVHERNARRKAMLALPLVVVAAVVVYAFLGR